MGNYLTETTLKNYITEKVIKQQLGSDLSISAITAQINVFIEDAEDQVNAACRGAYDPLPFEEVPSLIRKITAYLVVYQIYSLTGKMAGTPKANYDLAILLLLRIQNMQLQLTDKNSDVENIFKGFQIGIAEPSVKSNGVQGYGKVYE